MDGITLIKGNIAYLLVALLMAVSMTTLTVTVIHIVQGDRESVKKFLSWAIISAIGVALIRAVGHPQATYEICTGVYNVVVALAKILRICMGIGAASSLVVVTVRAMKGDRESAEHFLYWLVGFSAGVAILSVLI